MNLLETAWRQLVQRRLLPVAILLVAALAAVPFVLAEDVEPASPVTVPAEEETTASTAAVGEPIVDLVEDGEPARRRRVLGARKNPFQPAAAPRPEATPAPGGSLTGGTPAGGSDAGGGSPVTTDGSSIGGAGAPSGPATPAQPGVTEPVPPAAAPKPKPRPRHELYSLTVRFGDSSSDQLKRMNVARLKPLPSADDAILVYLGVARDEKTAIFMVDDSVVAQGDGQCKPSPSNCETIHLRQGDTEFFDVVDEAGNVQAQYQLELVKIQRKTTSDASKAKAARERVAKSGRQLLRARQAAQGPLRFRYDAEAGVVRRLGKQAYEAAVARTALAMSGSFDVER
jgi:hypothetical protein